PSKNGRLIEQASARFIRLLTHVPGTSIFSISPSSALLANVGKALAQLDLALARISRRAPQQNLAWAIQKATDLLPSVDLLVNAQTRTLVAHAFENFHRRTFPHLDAMRSQIIHNDFNATNVLIDESRSNRISGVIDFGDLTFAPAVNDLAVA